MAVQRAEEKLVSPGRWAKEAVVVGALVFTNVLFSLAFLGIVLASESIRFYQAATGRIKTTPA